MPPPISRFLIILSTLQFTTRLPLLLAPYTRRGGSDPNREEQLAKFSEKEKKAIHNKHRDHIDPAMVKAGQHAQQKVMQLSKEVHDAKQQMVELHHEEA